MKRIAEAQSDNDKEEREKNLEHLNVKWGGWLGQYKESSLDACQAEALDLISQGKTLGFSLNTITPVDPDGGRGIVIASNASLLTNLMYLMSEHQSEDRELEDKFLLMMDVIITGGFPVKHMEQGWEMIHSAMDLNLLSVIGLLLQHGAHVDDVDTRGRSALIHAAIDGNLDGVEYMVARGANLEIQSDQGSALRLTLRGSNRMTERVRIIEQLVTAGANPEAKNARGLTPIMAMEEDFREGWSVKMPEHEQMKYYLEGAIRSLKEKEELQSITVKRLEKEIIEPASQENQKKPLTDVREQNKKTPRI